MSIARSTTAVAGAFLLFTVAGCGGDSHESLADEMTAKMKEVTAQLKEIKDLASAKAASPKLKAIGEDIKSIKARMDKLPKATDEQQKALAEKMEKSFGPVLGDLLTEGMRIQGLGPDVAKELDSSMEAMKGM